MKCKNCGGTIIDNRCIKCGRLTNGKKVNINKNDNDKFYLQKKYNKNFDSMYRNEKTYINFFLGPLYFSYRGHFFTGTILVFLDFFIYIFLTSIIIINPAVSKLIRLIYLFINRLIYATISNSVCLFIDNLKISRIKKKYKANYIEKLEKHKHRELYLPLTIIFYLIIIVLCLYFN